MAQCTVFLYCDFITPIDSRLCGPFYKLFENIYTVGPKMATTEYNNAIGDHKLNNTLPQDRIAQNNDPILDPAHHDHLHHDVPVKKGNDDEMAYSNRSAIDKSTIPDQTTHDHDVHKSEGTHQHDIEVVDPRPPKSLGLYTRYRIIFHLLIWLFFTG